MTNNYTYSLLANSTSIQRSDGASIPADPRNSDYMQYQAWVSAGNTPTPVPAPTLADVQAAQIAALNASYQAAITADVSFTTAAGVAKTFQSDSNSQNNLLLASTGYTFAGATPPGFFWVASDNSQVPFTLPDLHGLYLAMLSQGQLAFAHLQTQKVAVNAATTAAAVQAINW